MVKEMPPIGNLDPSRGLRLAGNDRRAGGHDDPDAFDALLITPVSCAMLPAPPLSPALCAAVSLPAIAAHANPKHQPAIRVATKPLPENNFP